MFTAFNLREYTLSPEENVEVEKLREQTYSQWNWNYGASPPYQVRKTRCIEGCGKFDMLLDVEKEGIIKGITFYDDFLGNADPDALTAKLTGHHLEYGELKETLGSVDVSRYFHHLNTEHLLSLLLE